MNGIMIVLFFLSSGSLFFLLTLQSYAVFSPPPYFSLFFVSPCCDTRPYLRQIEEKALKSVAKPKKNEKWRMQNLCDYFIISCWQNGFSHFWFVDSFNFVSLHVDIERQSWVIIKNLINKSLWKSIYYLTSFWWLHSLWHRTFPRTTSVRTMRMAYLFIIMYWGRF